MNTELSEQNSNCIFHCIFGEKCQYYICTLSPHYGPFLFLFQASWHVQYTFLKDGFEDKNYLLVKRITFQSCILKKTQKLVQRTSAVHLAGVFPLKIIKSFKKYYFLTGVLLEIKKKKKFFFNQQIA